MPQNLFYIVAVSFPFLGIYNGGAALFRAVGDSKVSMKVSLVANLVNIAGNAILIMVQGSVLPVLRCPRCFPEYCRL